MCYVRNNVPRHECSYFHVSVVHGIMSMLCKYHVTSAKSIMLEGGYDLEIANLAAIAIENIPDKSFSNSNLMTSGLYLNIYVIAPSFINLVQSTEILSCTVHNFKMKIGQLKWILLMNELIEVFGGYLILLYPYWIRIIANPPLFSCQQTSCTNPFLHSHFFRRLIFPKYCTEQHNLPTVQKGSSSKMGAMDKRKLWYVEFKT